jgi:nitrite reductase (NAD(P)H)
MGVDVSFVQLAHVSRLNLLFQVASFGDFFAEKRHLERKRAQTSTRVQRGGPANSVPMSGTQRSINAPSQPVWEITNKPAVPESPSLTVSREIAAEESKGSTSDPSTEAHPPEAPPVAASSTTQDVPATAPLTSPELRRVNTPPLGVAPAAAPADGPKKDASAPRKRHGAGAAADGPIETLTYRDPFAGVYKKYIFSADGKYLLGGMMVGDTSDYVKMVALVKKKV